MTLSEKGLNLGFAMLNKWYFPAQEVECSKTESQESNIYTV